MRKTELRKELQKLIGKKISKCTLIDYTTRIALGNRVRPDFFPSDQSLPEEKWNWEVQFSFFSGFAFYNPNEDKEGTEGCTTESEWSILVSQLDNEFVKKLELKKDNTLYLETNSGFSIDFEWVYRGHFGLIIYEGELDPRIIRINRRSILDSKSDKTENE